MLDARKLLQARTEGRTVPITTFTVDEAVTNGTFRFAPPLIDRSPSPKALYLEWRALQFVFDELADPHSFPPLLELPPERDREVFERYIAAAEELAESQLLCGDDWVNVKWDGERNVETVTSNFTSKEITRGFAVLLRQFDAKEEPASFQTVSGRLRKLSRDTADGQADARCQQIDAWRKGQGALHAKELQHLARAKLAPGMEYGSEHPPTHYLSAYNYGELIHWDRGRQTLAEWEKDAFQRDWQRMAFLEAAIGLAILYIGFSEVVRTAIAGDA